MDVKSLVGKEGSSTNWPFKCPRISTHSKVLGNSNVEVDLHNMRQLILMYFTQMGGIEFNSTEK